MLLTPLTFVKWGARTPPFARFFANIWWISMGDLPPGNRKKTLAGYTGASFQRSTRAGSNADAPHFAVPFQVNPVGPVSTVRALRLHPIQFCVGQMRGHCRVHDTSGQNTRLLVGSNLGQNRNTS